MPITTNQVPILIDFSWLDDYSVKVGKLLEPIRFRAEIS